MPTVTLSSKHQITLPMEVVRALGLKPGDKLVAELIDDHLVLLPQPESWVDYFSGSARGVYGSTKEEIDRYIAEVRYGWDIDALKDALSVDAELRAVYEATSSSEARDLAEIARRAGLDHGCARKQLEKLVELNAARQVEHPELKALSFFRRIP